MYAHLSNTRHICDLDQDIRIYNYPSTKECELFLRNEQNSIIGNFESSKPLPRKVNLLVFRTLLEDKPQPSHTGTKEGYLSSFNILKYV